MKRAVVAIGAAALATGIAVAGVGYRNALGDPIVRDLHLAAPIEPVSILLLSDIHVVGPDMPPDRAQRIVAQINALRPDIVLLAGDFVSDRAVASAHYSTHDAIAPLAARRALASVPSPCSAITTMNAVRPPCGARCRRRGS